MVPVKVTNGKRSCMESSGDKGKLENGDHIIAVTDYKNRDQLTPPGIFLSLTVGPVALCLAIA